MSTIWMQSRFGKRIDMLEPRVQDVDFREACLTLAHINRYSGAASPTVSVAFHSMIADDLAPPDIRPWVILHDFHEYVVGDGTTPFAQALNAIANRRTPFSCIDTVKKSIHELKLIHDFAIFTAAGLPMPTAEQRQRIREIDLRALATERRDFMAPSPMDWDAECQNAVPASNIYVGGQYGWRPEVVAERLHQRLEKLLPCFQSNLAEAA